MEHPYVGLSEADAEATLRADLSAVLFELRTMARRWNHTLPSAFGRLETLVHFNSEQENKAMEERDRQAREDVAKSATISGQYAGASTDRRLSNEHMGAQTAGGGMGVMGGASPSRGNMARQALLERAQQLRSEAYELERLAVSLPMEMDGAADRALWTLVIRGPRPL